MTLFKFNWRFFNDLFSKCKFYFSFLFFFLFSFFFSFCNSTNDHALIPEIRKLRKDAAFSQFSQSFSSTIKDHNTYYRTVERANVKRTWTLKILPYPYPLYPFSSQFRLSFVPPFTSPIPVFPVRHFITAFSHNVDSALPANWFT